MPVTSGAAFTGVDVDARNAATPSATCAAVLAGPLCAAAPAAPADDAAGGGGAISAGYVSVHGVTPSPSSG